VLCILNVIYCRLYLSALSAFSLWFYVCFKLFLSLKCWCFFVYVCLAVSSCPSVSSLSCGFCLKIPSYKNLHEVSRLSSDWLTDCVSEVCGCYWWVNKQAEVVPVPMPSIWCCCSTWETFSELKLRWGTDFTSLLPLTGLCSSGWSCNSPCTYSINVCHPVLLAPLACYLLLAVLQLNVNCEV